MTAVPLGRAPVSVQELARIERMFLDAENELNRQLESILRRGPEWFREEARLRRLLEATREQMAVLQQAFDEPTISGALGELYAQGASTQEGLLQQAFNWNNPHLGAVDRIAGDTFDDLLTATRYVEQSAKQIIRQAAKLNTSRKLTTGRTAIQAGNALARDLRASGIGVVTYRNGARHGVGEYARMVLRTKTAVAYNSGTLNFVHAAGVKVVEIFDGSDCGLSYHDDPTLANGLIVDTLTAATYVIAHPNCRRSFGARPDLTEKEAGQFRPSTTADQRADQQAFEKFMRDDKRAKPHPPREPRAPRTPRVPRGEVQQPFAEAPAGTPDLPAAVAGSRYDAISGALSEVASTTEGLGVVGDAYGWGSVTSREAAELAVTTRTALVGAGMSLTEIDALEQGANAWLIGSVDTVRSAYAGWLNGTSIAELPYFRKIAEEGSSRIRAVGERMSAGFEEMFAMLRDGPRTESLLFRGMALPPDVVSTLEPGARFSADLASWSREPKVADVFRKVQADNRGSVSEQVVMRLEPGAPGFDIGVIGDHPYGWQREVLVSGDYEIIGVERDAEGVLQVDVRAAT